MLNRVAFLFVGLTVGSLGGGVVDGAERPNVLFFLVDDLGYADLGCFGSEFYETPHIDGLAASGARLTNAYAACPVCSPTRASIMTGKYPARLNATDWFGARQPERWDRNTQLLPASYLEHLPSEETTLAEAFADAGYQTFFAGKWHLGPEGSWPEDHGFAINRGGCQWGHPRGKNRYFSPYGNPRLEDGPKGEHLTARLADETCRFIERAAGEPFFAYLSFYTVHTPLMAPTPLKNKYKAKLEARGGVEATRWGSESTRSNETRRVRQTQNHPVYAAMVESLDSAVGKVLTTLAVAGVADNTIVVFTSDNGGLSTSEGSPTSNLPLRAGKGWLYEGGVREPTIVRWPGTTEPGTTCDAVVTSTDYFPTLLDAVGLEPREAQHVDGASFAAALRGEAPSGRPVYWHYPHYGNQGSAPGAAVRDGRWKLIRWYEGPREELFDLEADLGEQRDLSSDEPEVRERLAGLLDRWLEEVGAQMPTENPGYQPGKPRQQGNRKAQRAAKPS